MKRGNVLKIFRIISSIVAILGVMSFTCRNAYVHATSNAEKAFREAGIEPTGDISGLFPTFTSVDYIVVIALVGFLTVGMFIWELMTLASSRGKPQQRAVGFLRLCSPIVGAYIIFKVYNMM